MQPECGYVTSRKVQYQNKIKGNHNKPHRKHEDVKLGQKKALLAKMT